mmetsp:Transcript_88431/g.286335  ORF Transcript_88431/g.286335 Transcript_88431/m.286335 type:complete len:212 (-) Transcript_88431:720-1355(-)
MAPHGPLELRDFRLDRGDARGRGRAAAPGDLHAAEDHHPGALLRPGAAEAHHRHQPQARGAADPRPRDGRGVPPLLDAAHHPPPAGAEGHLGWRCRGRQGRRLGHCAPVGPRLHERHLPDEGDRPELRGLRQLQQAQRRLGPRREVRHHGAEHVHPDAGHHLGRLVEQDRAAHHRQPDLHGHLLRRVPAPVHLRHHEHCGRRHRAADRRVR